MEKVELQQSKFRDRIEQCEALAMTVKEKHLDLQSECMNEFELLRGFCVQMGSDVLSRVQTQIKEQVETSAVKQLQTFRDEICEVLELVHKTPFNLIHDLERKLDEMKENSID
jgi:Ni,Fe-hydrogenase III large subunit